MVTVAVSTIGIGQNLAAYYSNHNHIIKLNARWRGRQEQPFTVRAVQYSTAVLRKFSA